MAGSTSPYGGLDHALSAAVPVHAATAAVSGSPNARSRLGMPPRAWIGTTVPSRTRNRSVRLRGEATTDDTAFEDAVSWPLVRPMRCSIATAYRADVTVPVTPFI